VTGHFIAEQRDHRQREMTGVAQEIDKPRFKFRRKRVLIDATNSVDIICQFFANCYPG
jgi:hypothetical protein